MSIRDTILSGTLLEIAVEVRIDGTLVPDVLEVQTSAGFDQINAEATIVCAARPSWALEGQAVEIHAGYNGEVAQIHGGVVIGFDWETWSPRVGILCQDKLARARETWGGAERVYTNQTDEAIARNLLEALGIPSSQASITLSGVLRGTIQEVVLATGDTPWSLLARLARWAGCRIFSGTNGIIYGRRVSGGTGATAAWTFQQDVDILRAKRSRSTRDICNQFTMKGLTYEGIEVEGSASASNTYLDALMPPDLRPYFVGDEEQDDLIESEADAIAVAQREVADRNRRPEGADLEVIGNPLLQPAMTGGIDASDLEVANGLVFLVNVKHSITLDPPNWTTSVRTTGGNLSGYNAAAPIAQLKIDLVLEALDDGSGPAGLIVAVASSIGSFDPDGSEDGLTYDWEISAVGGAPSSTTQTGGAVCRFTLPATATSVTVVLTVTDPDGLTGTAQATRAIVPAELPVEDLSTAEGVVVAYSSDGQQTWREPVLPGGTTAACLAPFAAEWGQIWGAADGHCYATFDAGASLIDLGQPCGTSAELTALWIHELTNTRLWAANAAGVVAFGELNLTTKTVSWSVRGTIGAGPVVELRESIAQLGTLAAMAGQGYYLSTDSGSTWTLKDSGDTAGRLADGFGKNVYTFLNDDRPLRIVDSPDPIFPDLDPPVRHVRAVTFGWRVNRLYCADDQGRLFIGEPPNYDMQLADTTLAIVNHMQRSGNVDGVIYLAVGDGTDNAGGVMKWLPEA